MQHGSAVRRRKALPERVRLVATEHGLPVTSPRGREAPVAGAAFRRCEVSELRTATAPAAADHTLSRTWRLPGLDLRCSQEKKK